MSTLEIQCYNKGCGKKFSNEDNSEDSCIYHPGEPIFHDAYKSWSCCQKKSTDFTTFLNTKGCAKGKHNPEKPIIPEKQNCNSDPNEVIVVEPRKPLAKAERPSYSLPLVRLPVSILPSLSQALEKLKNAEKEGAVNDASSEDSIKKGEPCKNNTCVAVYDGDFSNLETCTYHPGSAIFHEGLKYWSCCKKKSTDFNEFLEQKGCTNGKHLWIKKEAKKVQACKFDWYQTGTHVYVTVYAKNTQPEFSYVEANPIRLKFYILFGKEEVFEMDIELKGVINPEESSIAMGAAKVELKLRKGEAMNWSYLAVERAISKESKEDAGENEALCDEIETVDISDI